MNELQELKQQHEELGKRIEALEKPELQIGKWYIGNMKGEDYLMVWNNGRSTYGFFNGNWGKNWTFLKCGYEYLRLATKEEIESHLIKEAKRRGFKKGVRYSSADNGGCATVENYGDYVFKYYTQHDGLTDGCGGYVYHKGKWAEIISDPIIIKTSEGDKEVEFNIVPPFLGPEAHIGCTYYSQEQLECMLKWKDGLTKQGRKTIEKILEKWN